MSIAPPPPHAQPQGHLVLIRHGETEWSKTGQHTGVTDLPLLPEGEEGARLLAPLVSGFDIALALSSPLRRARRTAELAGVPDYEVDHDLVEWNYGPFEGLTTKDIRERLGYDWSAFRDGFQDGEAHGETVEEVAGRASRVLRRVMPVLQEHDVALVGHGHMLRILTTVFLRAEPRLGAKLLLDAGSISVLEYEREEPAVRLWNHRPGKDGGAH